LGQNDLPGAREALAKAVQLAPGMVRAREALAKVCRDLGMKEQAYQEESILITQMESSVGDLLNVAWKHMERTAWKSADSTLTRATKVGPVDARVQAYLGILRLAEKKPAEALSAFRVGQALEEARLRLMGVTTQGGSVTTRSPDEFALLMTLRQRIAAMHLTRGNFAEVLELAQNNLSLEPLIAVSDQLRDLPTSMLPDVDPNPDYRPEPENASSLLAWSHYYAGQALRGLGRAGDAMQHFQAAQDAGRSLSVGQGTRALTEPRNRAGFAMCWLLLQRGDVQGAQTLVNKLEARVRHQHSKELAAEQSKLRDAIQAQFRTGFGRPGPGGR
jgi:tetratricopeptide (TPR) repeat protein